MSENTSTSEFGGSEPLSIDYYKAKLEEARERIKQLELELEKARRMYHKAAGEI